MTFKQKLSAHASSGEPALNSLGRQRSYQAHGLAEWLGAKSGVMSLSEKWCFLPLERISRGQRGVLRSASIQKLLEEMKKFDVCYDMI